MTHQGIRRRFTFVLSLITSISTAGTLSMLLLSSLVGCQARNYCSHAMSMGAPASQELSRRSLLRESSLGESEDGTSHDVDFNTETYDYIVENPFLDPTQSPLSTFAADVDTASYSNIRRFINNGNWPPPGAVRIEEMVNYFSYDYSPPHDSDHPFAVHAEITDCPWNVGHRLAAIGIKAWDVETENRPPANLIFLIDVSGSMQPAAKLPLLKNALTMLARDIRPDDRVGIAVYAGSARKLLQSTPGSQRKRIINAVNSLSADGSTNGEGGLELAYEMATENLIENGINRVILATDGDFNIGTTNQSDLIRIIEKYAKTGIDLTVLGFGMGNYKDSTLEKLADHGNGNYAYIDNINEARRTLIDHMGATLFTIAKDVKLQVEFNPAEVAAYRLIGYENRIMPAQDFYDDDKDAGEIGAGHTVTALYEIIPAGAEHQVPQIDDLKYQTKLAISSDAQTTGELFTVRIRYRNPDGSIGDEISVTASDTDRVIDQCSNDLRFASAVAEFGLLLRHSKFKGRASFDQVLALARSARGEDPFTERAEFIRIVQTTRSLAPNRTASVVK